jgi:hypothetical protein
VLKSLGGMTTTTTTTTRTGTGITYLKYSAVVKEQTLRPAHSAEKIHKVRVIRTVTNVAKKAELRECTVKNHGSESLASIWSFL